MRKWRRVLTWAGAVLAVGLALAVVFTPVDTPTPLTHLDVSLGPSPQSGTRVAAFELKQYWPEVVIRLSTDLRGTGVGVGVNDAQGNLLCNAQWYSGKGRFLFGFSPPKGFPAGRYGLRVVENQALGRYRVEVLPRRPKDTTMLRFLGLVAAGLLVIGGLSTRAWLRERRGQAEPQTIMLKRVAQWLVAAVALGFAYVLAHEGGHALAMLAFGVGVDIHQSDFLGLRGQPGVMGGSTPRDLLAAWQNATIAAAGAALPDILAYISFGFWLSGPGKRLRSKFALVDEIWSWAVGVFLFAHFGWVLAVTGLVRDADYVGLMSNVGDWRTAANVIILAFGVINAVIIYIVARHLVDHFRKLARTGG